MSDIRRFLDVLSPKSNLLTQLEEARLPLKPGNTGWARGSYGMYVVVIKPMDFIRLTTSGQEEIDTIFSDEFVDLDTFKKGEDERFNRWQYNMPFLNVAYPSGKVTGHEGRHRAAMVHKAGGNKFPFTMFLRADTVFTVTWEISDFSQDIDDGEPKKAEFKSRAEAAAFVNSLEKENDAPGSLYNDRIKINPEGGWPLKGHPDRSEPFEYAKWTTEDFPKALIGQFDQSIVVPATSMKYGLVKGYSHFKR